MYVCVYACDPAKLQDVLGAQSVRRKIEIRNEDDEKQRKPRYVQKVKENLSTR